MSSMTSSLEKTMPPQMKSHSKNPQQQFWPRLVMRKWLNIPAKESDYSADEDESDSDSPSPTTQQDFGQRGRGSRFKDIKEDDDYDDPDDFLPRVRRRKSETFRAQYINTKELRVRVGTWNVGGQTPPEDLDIDGWLDINDPADIYVIGLQEIVPLNAGNIFGAEDSRPVSKWENVIRETLDRFRPTVHQVKSFSDPPSPSKFRPLNDVPYVDEEILDDESDSDVAIQIHPVDDELNEFSVSSTSVTNETVNIGGPVPILIDSTKPGMPIGDELQRQHSSPKRLDRLYCFRPDDCSLDGDTSGVQQNGNLTETLSESKKIGLSWPERPLNLLSQHLLERQNSFKPTKSFKQSKSFRTYNSFKSVVNDKAQELPLLGEIDLEALMKRERRSSYVRIVSKQMVGIFVTVWVRRSLRKHIQNLKVSTVGVGVMGYIGNKGAVSVSMSIYQTLFCFVCTHLTAGEKEVDEQKRNADVHEIHRRTHFHSFSGIGLPKSIHDHERIIWLGDLNYRINLSYEKTRELISKKDWYQLAEKDQLARQFKKGRAFDGWSEGVLNFPPTYKYEMNSDKYYGDDPKGGRRTPAWCDRILSFGRGLRLLHYKRIEHKFSDHRPVTATYMAEVEVFSPRKLQRALTFTDAEIESEEIVTGVDVGMTCLKLEQGISDWAR